MDNNEINGQSMRPDQEKKSIETVCAIADNWWHGNLIHVPGLKWAIKLYESGFSKKASAEAARLSDSDKEFFLTRSIQSINNFIS